ncbi:MAG: IPT/TIG domain-containing protein [bacterium]
MLKKIRPLLIILLFWGIQFQNCAEEPAPSLFDPNEQGKPTPVITSIVPADSAFAGVGQVVINGENFSTTPAENLVFFNEVRAEVVAATNTQLTVKTPNLIGDGIVIRIAVHGAELFSEPATYKLIPAVSDFGKIFEGDIAYGIASDVSGNVFTFVQSRSNEIKVMTANGATTYAATPFLNAIVVNNMKMGPDNLLFVAPTGRLRRINTYAADGSEAVYVSPPIRPQDLDFDSGDNLWIVGGSKLVLVKPDKSVQEMATFPVNRLLTVRIFNNFVYVGGIDTNTGEEKIWRVQMQGENVSAPEVVLDVASNGFLNGEHVLCLTFAEDGDMILGTTHANGILILHADGGIEPLYPGLFLPQIYALSWAEGPTLFAVRQRESEETPNTFDFSQIYKISMDKNGAPYYGR